MHPLIFFFAFAALFSPAVERIDQDTLKSYLEKGAPFEFVLVDVRDAEEISSAIGSASCKPYNFAWPAGLKELIASVPKDMPVIVYCRSGSRAARAAALLSSSGFTRVYDAGGMLSWTGPTVPSSDIRPASLLPKPSCGESSTSAPAQSR